MPLRRRVQLVIAAFFLLIAFDFLLDVQLVRQRDDVQGSLEQQLEPARADVYIALTALVDQETAERGYIITGDPSFLAPYEEGGEQFDATIASLERHLREYPDLLAAVDRIRSRVSAWRQLGAEFEIRAKQAGRDEEATALVATGTAKTLFDRARTEIADLRQELHTILLSEQQELARSQDRINLLRRISFVVAAALLLATGILLGHWITAPLDRLRQAVRAVASGDLEHPIPSTGPPELAELGTAVEGMRRRILDEVEDASRAREALTKKGMVVLTLGEELSPSRDVSLPPGIKVAVKLQPAEGIIAGDWCEVLQLDGKVAFALVDVSGHGPSSGIFALRTKQLILAALRTGMEPAQALEWVSYQLGDTGEHFLTGVVGQMEPGNGRVRYASAGHPPMLLRNGRHLERLGPTGPILGGLEGTWRTAAAVVPPSGFLAVYSDGLIEARGSGNGEFGIERLAQVLVSEDPGDLDSLAERCIAAVRHHEAGPRHDDITLVLLGLDGTSAV